MIACSVLYYKYVAKKSTQGDDRIGRCPGCMAPFRLVRLSLLLVDEELEAGAGLTDLVDRHVSEGWAHRLPAHLAHHL